MVQNVSIDKLKEAEYNPRVPLEAGMPDYEHLKRSIQHFGNVEPVVWNERTGNVVGGHQRLRVLKDLGYTEIPCTVVNLDDEEEKVLNLALNKIKGEWDWNKLDEMLAGFDMEVATLSGFSADELALFLSSNEDGIEENPADDAWDDGQDNIYGSYVVTLIFASNALAREWAEANGYDGQIREGTETTVIRIE